MVSKLKEIKNAQLGTCLGKFDSGEIVILFDDLGRSPAYYLLSSGSKISTQTIAKMVNLGRSVICVAISASRVKELNLPKMSQKQNSQSTWAFTASVEARQGVTTGISAADRACTIQVLTNTENPKLDLVMPGHIFPVEAKDGGVLIKSAVPEAALDLSKMARGLLGSESTDKASTGTAFCHLLNESGALAKKEEVEKLAKDNKLSIVNLSTIVEERLSQEKIIEQVSSAKLPIRNIGEFKAIVFRSKLDDSEHIALVKGEINSENKATLVRVQSENRLTDLFGPEIHPSRKAISGALKIIEKEGGIFVYIRHRRKNLLQNQVNKLNSINSPSKASNLRELGIGAQILSTLGANKIKLIGQTQPNIAALKAYKIEVVGQHELAS